MWLTILAAQMGLHLRADGSVDTSAFKIVYVAPMKALVAEMVGNFSERLKEYNMQVRAKAVHVSVPVSVSVTLTSCM